jgi:trimeric autotransporter adhesin
MPVVINGDTGISPVTASGTSASVDGMTVGRGGGEVSTNTAVGTSALNANTSGATTTAIGYQAAYSNTTGTLNTALGMTSLYTNTTGTQNVAVGHQSMQRGTGSYNTAVGLNSLQEVTGSYNTAVGNNALNANTSASNNTAVGYQSIYTNTTGADNTAVGRLALNANTTGSSNVAMGNSAMVYNTTGNNNIGIGQQALTSNTTASNNTAMGYQAAYSNTTGINNTVVGSLAGDAGTFNYSTIIGARAGGAQTSGDQNTYVGEEAGGAMTTGGRNTIIGRYTGNAGGLDIRTSSSYIVLSDGDGNPRAHWNGSGAFSTTTTTSGWSQVFTNAATGINTLGLLISWAGAPNNTAGQFINCSDNANARFIVYANGNTVNQNNSYGAVSDIKLKENIVDATPKLEDLCKVKVRQYNLKSDPTHKQIGVVAQELEEVFAGMVEETPDKDQEGNDLGTTTKGVKYSVFVPMLIKSIQELKTIVDAQAAEIAELKAK